MSNENGAWRVQIGKGKSRYRDRWLLNSRGAAELYYSGLNTHSGHKKRLVGPDGKIIARYISDGTPR